MRISDWSSDVCSSDLESMFPALLDRLVDLRLLADAARAEGLAEDSEVRQRIAAFEDRVLSSALLERHLAETVTTAARSEEHTSELQSLMRISYAVFCLTKKKQNDHR